MSALATWVLGLMVALDAQSPWRASFDRTAAAIAKVAEENPLFEDPDGAHRTASVLVAVAWYESHFKADARSGNGRWLCLFQVDRQNLPDPQKALDDPEVCTRAAAKILRVSLARCADRGPDDRLAYFTSGSCDRGVKESRFRMSLARKLLKEHPPSG